jgi:type VI secretion system protein ImpH
MATITWRKNPSVEEALEKDIHGFEFDQVIHALECLHPNTTPLGEGTDPTQEAVAIKSRVTLAAPASELYKLDAKPGQKPTLWINFLSIAGIQGPLPMPYTETLVERIRVKDTAFPDFLDIFNHRLASLWHRLRKKITPGFGQVEPEDSAVGKTILQLAGVNLEKKVGNLDPKILLGYYHLLWSKPHSSAGLLCFLTSFFQTPVQIHNFQGAWNTATEEEISRIGYHLQHNILGRSMILGSRSWNQTANVCVELGPLSWEKFLGFLPLSVSLSSQHSLIGQIVQLYCGHDVTVSLKLSIKADEARPTTLNGSCALGFTAWIPTYKKSFIEPCIMVKLPIFSA